MKKHFTLLELLIVIAIIGILCTLLLPSLSNARAQAKTAMCLSNLAQINKGVMAHISHNDGRLPIYNKDEAESSSTTRHIWPSYVNRYLTGDLNAKITENKLEGDNSHSPLWTGCPSTIFTREMYIKRNFMASEYSGIFGKKVFDDKSKDWPVKPVSIISDPGSAGIITEAIEYHEKSDTIKSDSSLRVGPNVTHDNYNEKTGYTHSVIRHFYNTKMNVSKIDGSAVIFRWANKDIFEAKFTKWFEDFN